MFCFVCFIFNSEVTEKNCVILLENSRHLKGLVQEEKKSIRVRKKNFPAEQARSASRLALGMLGLALLSEPLIRLFCRLKND